MGNSISLQKLKDSEINMCKSNEFLTNLQQNEPKFIENQKSNRFKFFWVANENPDEVNDISECIWAPYDNEDCLFLEYWYEKYKNGNHTSPQLGEYVIDFNNWIQYHHTDKWRQRRITREDPDNINFIFRKSRFDKNFSFSNFKETKIDEIQYKSTDKELGLNKKFPLKKFEISSNYKEIEFKIIKSEINLKFKLQYCYYNKIKNLNFSMDYKYFVNELKKEINTIAKELGRFNFYNIYYLNSIEEKNFFQFMIKMYTEESFLYKLINKVLREKDNDLFEKIKLYFISLIASYQYYSSNSLKSLMESSIIPPKIKDTIESENKIVVFRGTFLTPEEILVYENNSNKNIPFIRIYNEFISTSLNHNVARKFASNCLIELEINTENNIGGYAFLDKQLSVFQNEAEVLLRSGSIIKIDNFIKESDTFFKISGSLISFDLKEFILFHFKDKELNLSSNSIGSNPDNMRGIAEGLKFNNYIQELDLRSSLLGSNPHNLMYLAEALKVNNSIKKLYLYNNSLGYDRNNLKYLSDALKLNNSIQELGLSSNYLGIYNENVFYLAMALKVNRTIQTLDLEDNSLGLNSENSLHLAEALILNNSIKNLRINENDLGSNTVNIKILADAFKVNDSLNILRINKNFLGNNIKYIAEALQDNKSICELDLNDNCIGDNLKYLVEALKYNKSIKILRLNYNSLGVNLEIFNDLLNVIQVNYFIKELSIQNNYLSADQKIKIEILKKSKDIKIYYSY